MLKEKYKVRADIHYEEFEFVSVGNNGRILKIVLFTKQEGYDNLYNLGFGDKNVQTGEISDTIKSNNGDTEKVLATVAGTVLKFMEKHPKAMIAAIGSTPTRTRLYQMGISQNFEEINTVFEVLGLTENGWELFERNKNYMAFLVKRK